MTDYLNELFERITKPITEENPCGEAARHDERFENTKTEIMKLTAGTAEIKWNDILSNTDSLLGEKTKDLTIVAYLSLVLIKQYEYPGLLIGLKTIHYFIDNYWELMYPPIKRKKARIQTFEWMNERLSVMVGATEPKAEHADALRECKALADELPAKVRAAVDGPVTGFSGLKKEINIWIGKLPEPKAEPVENKPTDQTDDTTKKEVQESAQQPAPAPIKAAETKMEVPAPPEELASIDEGLRAIINIIHLIRKTQPHKAIAYRLARVTKWGDVENAPASTPDGKTKIPPPSSERLNILEKQLMAANWPLLTQTAEHMFMSGAGCTFNLNLQRYVAMGLENQGFADASKAVLAETGMMLLRLSELPELTYDSGLPFADEETRQWVEVAIQEVKETGPLEIDIEQEDDDQWLKEATKIAREKSMAKALPVFQQAVSTAKDTKSIMKRQLDVAEFFVNNSETQWAVPILESLLNRVEEVRLVEWDPIFCSNVWELLLKGYKGLPKEIAISEEQRSKTNTIRQKLFNVNMVKAAGLTPKK